MAEYASVDLPLHLRGSEPSLTAAGQRLVALLLEDLGAASRMTIDEVSERAGISQASVVRTSRALGFRGYPELRLALAAASSHSASARTVVGDITEDDDLEQVLMKLAAQESAALEQTAAGLDRDALRGTVEAIAGARTVDVYGVAASALVAMDLALKLQRIGRHGRAHPDRHLAVTSAALLGAGDVAVGISHSGETPDVLAPIRRAAQGGAVTIALTSNPRSSIARAVDHVLVCAGEERLFRPGATASRISQLLVVDAIFVGVAQLDYPTTRAALDATREAVAELDRRRRR